MLKIGKHIFHIHFFNMDILLVIKVTIVQIVKRVPEIHCEGRVSQNFDIGPSFYFIFCRRVDFQKKLQKNTKVARFLL